MQIPEEKIEELQRIYKKNYNIELSKEEAVERGREILEFMDLIYEPLTKQDLKDVRERRKETQKMVDDLYDENQSKLWF
jgi:RecA-family ATPase